MTQKNMRIQKKSLCEKSMQLMVNIIKISSLSLATMNLGDNEHNPNSPLLKLTNDPIEPFSSNSQKRSSQAKSKVQTYLKEQDDHSRSFEGIVDDDGNFSDYIKKFHKRNQNEMNKAIINGKASAYIRRFHEKNGRDHSLATSTANVPLVLPLPPPLLKK
ncbi:hypothetical protein BUALT_Bualt17G0055800 [Buddleja alternifolia]|uniref:Uncharacterized protein n=1 Tax=Buddleja alternifolia TaxID=168488 RepID=A0AAV6W6G8_9LAMI|nr:hypothetical protein BUALT_Bualt17G0055800 [Buddleja alternifolia]